MKALMVTSVALAVLGGCGSISGGGAGGAPPTGSGAADPKQAAQQCEQSIQAAPQLSPEVKSKLEKVCAKAAKGDEKAVRDSTKQVCEAIIEETVPSGPAQAQARSACKQGP